MRKKKEIYYISHKYFNRDTGEILNEDEVKKQWHEKYNGDAKKNGEFVDQYLQIC